MDPQVRLRCGGKVKNVAAYLDSYRDKDFGSMFAKHFFMSLIAVSNLLQNSGMFILLLDLRVRCSIPIVGAAACAPERSELVPASLP
eukprot:530196-Pelagomonas_calceolata.AAC.1